MNVQAKPQRIFNFSAGPATLPLEVLEASAQALVNYQGKGVGIAEVSHRGKEFDAVIDEAITRCKSLLGVAESHDVLFLQGGATQLFTTIPMNFANGTIDYVVRKRQRPPRPPVPRSPSSPTPRPRISTIALRKAPGR
jgi:phosphoserine aminotransferase